MYLAIQKSFIFLSETNMLIMIHWLTTTTTKDCLPDMLVNGCFVEDLLADRAVGVVARLLLRGDIVGLQDKHKYNYLQLFSSRVVTDIRLPDNRPIILPDT